MKNLMSEELLKQLLNKMASLESRVQHLEAGHTAVNTVDPSYWQNGTTQLSNGYQPFEKDLPVRMPPKER